MDLHSIENKLIQTVQTLRQGESGVPVDWPSMPPLTEANQAQGANFSKVVDTLQWRAMPPGADPGISKTPGLGSLASPDVCLKRLRAMAEKINHLSLEQERAIAEMQALQLQLGQIQSLVNPQRQSSTPLSLDCNRSVLATAEVDEHGNIALGYRAPRQPHPPSRAVEAGSFTQPAHPLATHPQASYGRSPQRRRQRLHTLGAEILSLIQEPSYLVATCSRTLWHLVGYLTQWPLTAQAQPGATPSPTASRQSVNEASLSLVDSIFWLGGGVIGRLGLGLLITAFPALWSVAVAAITALMAYALYRATLAPKLAFGPILRVSLLVVGLVVGGHL